MLAHLQGAVEHYKFTPTTQRLLPLFEALANSLQAILLANETRGKIDVLVERDTRQASLNLREANIAPIKHIHVTDNGDGFHQLNYNAFNELYHPIKRERFGCKGIGRLVWFKTFETVKIKSTYKKGCGSFATTPQTLGFQSKLRQHMVYVYASLSRLDFQGLLENAIVVF